MTYEFYKPDEIGNPNAAATAMAIQLSTGQTPYFVSNWKGGGTNKDFIPFVYADSIEEAKELAEDTTNISFLNIIEPLAVNPGHGKDVDDAVRTIEFQADLAKSLDDGVFDRVDTGIPSQTGNKIPLDMNQPKDFFAVDAQEEKSPYKVIQVFTGGEKVLEKAVFVNNFINTDLAKSGSERDPLLMGRTFEAFRQLGEQSLGENVKERIAEMRGNERGSLDPYDPVQQLEMINEILDDDLKLGNIGRKLLATDEMPVKKIMNDEASQDKGREAMVRLKVATEKNAVQYAALKGELEESMLHGDAWWDNFERESSPKEVSLTPENGELLIGSLQANTLISSSDRAGKIVVMDLDDIGYGYRAMDIAVTINSIDGVDLETGKLSDNAKQIIRGSDEVSFIKDDLDKAMHTLLANAASYIAVMRIDKYANEKYTGRDPMGEVDKAEALAGAEERGFDLGIDAAEDLTLPTLDQFKRGARQGTWAEDLKAQSESYRNSEISK